MYLEVSELMRRYLFLLTFILVFLPYNSYGQSNDAHQGTLRPARDSGSFSNSTAITQGTDPNSINYFLDSSVTLPINLDSPNDACTINSSRYLETYNSLFEGRRDTGQTVYIPPRCVLEAQKEMYEFMFDGFAEAPDIIADFLMQQGELGNLEALRSISLDSASELQLIGDCLDQFNDPNGLVEITDDILSALRFLADDENNFEHPVEFSREERIDISRQLYQCATDDVEAIAARLIDNFQTSSNFLEAQSYKEQLVRLAQSCSQSSGVSDESSSPIKIAIEDISTFSLSFIGELEEERTSETYPYFNSKEQALASVEEQIYLGNDYFSEYEFDVFFPKVGNISEGLSTSIGNAFSNFGENLSCGVKGRDGQRDVEFRQMTSERLDLQRNVFVSGLRLQSLLNIQRENDDFDMSDELAAARSELNGSIFDCLINKREKETENRLTSYQTLANVNPNTCARARGSVAALLCMQDYSGDVCTAAEASRKVYTGEVPDHCILDASYQEQFSDGRPSEEEFPLPGFFAEGESPRFESGSNGYKFSEMTCGEENNPESERNKMYVFAGTDLDDERDWYCNQMETVYGAQLKVLGRTYDKTKAIIGATDFLRNSNYQDQVLDAIRSEITRVESSFMSCIEPMLSESNTNNPGEKIAYSVLDVFVNDPDDESRERVVTSGHSRGAMLAQISTFDAAKKLFKAQRALKNLESSVGRENNLYSDDSENIPASRFLQENSNLTPTEAALASRLHAIKLANNGDSISFSQLMDKIQMTTFGGPSAEVAIRKVMRDLENEGYNSREFARNIGKSELAFAANINHARDFVDDLAQPPVSYDEARVASSDIGNDQVIPEDRFQRATTGQQIAVNLRLDRILPGEMNYVRKTQDRVERVRNQFVDAQDPEGDFMQGVERINSLLASRGVLRDARISDEDINFTRNIDENYYNVDDDGDGEPDNSPADLRRRMRRGIMAHDMQGQYEYYACNGNALTLPNASNLNSSSYANDMRRILEEASMPTAEVSVPLSPDLEPNYEAYTTPR